MYIYGMRSRSSGVIFKYDRILIFEEASLAPVRERNVDRGVSVCSLNPLFSEFLFIELSFETLFYKLVCSPLRAGLKE